MALTKITRGVIKANENYDTHNINSTGIVTAVSANFTGDVSIGGTLTYQDVTNIDSVGIITARSGIISPYADIDDFVTVGSNIHLGNAGVITATSYRGDGSQLTGISADSTKIETGNTKVETIDTGSDGHVKITTEGTERLRIDSAGRVMLGTATPGPTAGEHLTIADSANAGITIRSGTTAAGTILFEDDTADRGEIQYSHNGDYMRFKTAGSERARIDSDGHLQIRREGVANVSGTDSRHTRYIIKQTNNQEAILGSVFAQGKSNWGGDLVFASKNANGDPASGLTERLRILSDGKVAIGGVTANSLLDVHGGDGISITHSGDTFLQSRTTGTTGTNYLEFKDSGGASGAISYHHNGNSLRFKVNGSERLRITSNGDIGIGNITPGNSFPNGKAIAIGDNDTGIRQNGDGILELWANNQQCFRVRTTGNLSYHTLSPGADNSVDLGTSSLRWRNIYTADLQMSNEGSANDVDGTWGKYTIQEGENDLFLINRRNGKKYKFNLTEVG